MDVHPKEVFVKDWKPGSSRSISEDTIDNRCK